MLYILFGYLFNHLLICNLVDNCRLSIQNIDETVKSAEKYPYFIVDINGKESLNINLIVLKLTILK